MKHLPEYLLLITSCLYSGTIQAKEKPSSPNLVFIMADQWRGQAIGCPGLEPGPDTQSGQAGLRRCALYGCDQQLSRLIPCPRHADDWHVSGKQQGNRQL